MRAPQPNRRRSLRFHLQIALPLVALALATQPPAFAASNLTDQWAVYHQSGLSTYSIDAFADSYDGEHNHVFISVRLIRTDRQGNHIQDLFGGTYRMPNIINFSYPEQGWFYRRWNDSRSYTHTAYPYYRISWNVIYSFDRYIGPHDLYSPTHLSPVFVNPIVLDDEPPID